MVNENKARLDKYIADIDTAYKSATSYEELFSLLDTAAKDIDPREAYALVSHGLIGFHTYDNGVDVVGFEMPV